MKDCPFCHIIKGEIPSKKVYSDGRFHGILDIKPAGPGHLLLMPKMHHESILSMPENEVGMFLMAIKKVSWAIIRRLEAKGTNIFMAIGQGAGQKVPHALTHIIPRSENDDIKNFDLQPKQFPQEQVDQIAKALNPESKELVVYEDDVLFARLNNPSYALGHIMLIPKKPHPILEQVPDETLVHIAKVMQKLLHSIINLSGVTGVNVLIHNGIAAGQKDNFFIIHLIPRMDNDGLDFSWPVNQMDEKILETIQKALLEEFGMGEKPQGQAHPQQKQQTQQQPEEKKPPIKLPTRIP